MLLGSLGLNEKGIPLQRNHQIQNNAGQLWKPENSIAHSDKFGAAEKSWSTQNTGEI